MVRDIVSGACGLLKLVPALLAVLFVAFVVNFRVICGDRDRMRRGATMTAAALTLIVIAVGTTIYGRYPAVIVPEEYAVYMTKERVDDIRSEFAGYARRKLSFVTLIKVERAGEDFCQCVVSMYFEGKIGETRYYGADGNICGGELWKP